MRVADGLDAVHDRQQRGQDERGENAGVHRKVVGRFLGEIAVADFEEGGRVKLCGRSANTEQLRALIALVGLRKGPAVARSARVGFMPPVDLLDLRCVFHYSCLLFL